MSESQLVACVPCGILVAFCGPSEAQLGPPSVRDGPGTSPQLGMGLGPPLDPNCRLISSPTMTTALQPNPEHLQNQLQLPRISRKLLIRTPLHTALCPCLKMSRRLSVAPCAPSVRMCDSVVDADNAIGTVLQPNSEPPRQQLQVREHQGDHRREHHCTLLCAHAQMSRR